MSHLYFRPRLSVTCAFSVFKTSRFLRSTHRPAPCSCHLNAGCRIASHRFAALLFPELFGEPGFDISFALTTLLQRFTFVHLHGAHLPIFYGLFPTAHLPCLLNRAAQGDLADLPVQSLPRGLPSSYVQLSQHTRTGTPHDVIIPFVRS